mmetsp:Transcript_24028/g.77545  ORF Transcript_24028/g.77545 Transcript_24028/m.77545 type:complete len:241 (+) Transcript_24028:229-951(+)
MCARDPRGTPRMQGCPRLPAVPLLLGLAARSTPATDLDRAATSPGLMASSATTASRMLVLPKGTLCCRAASASPSRPPRMTPPLPSSPPSRVLPAQHTPSLDAKHMPRCGTRHFGALSPHSSATILSSLTSVPSAPMSMARADFRKARASPATNAPSRHSAGTSALPLPVMDATDTRPFYSRVAPMDPGPARHPPSTRPNSTTSWPDPSPTPSPSGPSPRRPPSSGMDLLVGRPLLQSAR